MLAASARAIEARLGPDDLVLDVGGGWGPFPRADWVLDLPEFREGTRATPATGGGGGMGGRPAGVRRGPPGRPGEVGGAGHGRPRALAGRRQAVRLRRLLAHARGRAR